MYNFAPEDQHIALTMAEQYLQFATILCHLGFSLFLLGMEIGGFGSALSTKELLTRLRLLKRGKRAG